MKKFKVYLMLTCIYALTVFYLSMTSDPSEILAPIYFDYLIRFIFPLKGTNLNFIYNLALFLYFYFDKFGHFLFYAGMGLLLYLTLRSSGKTILEKYVYLFSLGIGMLYGTFIELLQAFLPWRSASLLDLTANCLGLLAMLFLIASLSFIFNRTLAKIVFLIIIITLPILLTGWVLSQYLLLIGREPAIAQYPLYIALVIALVFDLIILFSHKLLVRWYKGRRVVEGEAFEVLRRVSNKAGFAMPNLYVSRALNANIFSCGWDGNRASIVVGESALNLLDNEELEALFAHELFHIKSKHFFRSTLIAAFAGVLTMFATIALWAALLTGFGQEDDPAPQFIKFFAMALFAPPAAFLVQLFISRERVFKADRFAVELSNRGALKSALLKLNSQSKSDVNPSHAHLFAISPLGNNIFNSLFESHPPLTKRISVLEVV